MATVTDRNPSWLTSPSSGHALFETSSSSDPVQLLSKPTADLDDITPSRLTAVRSTELFVARNREIRLADVRHLKSHHPKSDFETEEAAKSGIRGYKTLDLPQLDFDVTQIEISEDGLFMAVVGERECAVVVLPGEGAAVVKVEKEADGKKEKRFVRVPSYHRVGRSFHNYESAAKIVKVLWHPLAVEGASLLVLTDDANIRVYDIVLGNDPSFEIPDQIFDLYALSGKKRHIGGFAADAYDMVPASFCFADGEAGWRPLTVYILMRGSGDIYGLSPVVPSRWAASPEYLQQLSVEIAADVEGLSEDATPEERNAARHQTRWINDVLNQQSIIAEADARFSTATTPRTIPKCLGRPTGVGPTPVLQGPFLFQPPPAELDAEEDSLACDIFHIETEATGIIGVVYSGGKVEISLEDLPLPARWIEKKPHKAAAPLRTLHDSLPVIANYETINLQFPPGATEFNSWPTFTKDALSPFLWFVNHNSGVAAFSMKPWIESLIILMDPDNVSEDEENHDEEDIMARFLGTAPPSVISQVITNAPGRISGSVVIYDPFAGYLLLAGHSNGVESAELEDESISLPSDSTPPNEDTAIVLQPQTPRTSSLRPSSTSVFHPFTSQAPSSQTPSSSPQPLSHRPFTIPAAFTSPSKLPTTLPKPSSGPIMFCTDTSTTLQLARDTLHSDVTSLFDAAQSLHDQAAHQHALYVTQLSTIDNLRSRLDVMKNRNLVERLATFIAKQKELKERMDDALRKVVLLGEGKRSLSQAEKMWAMEVGRVQRKLGELVERRDGVKEIVELVEGEAKEREREVEKGVELVVDGVPESVRKEGVERVMKVLKVEDEIIKNTRKQLEELELEVDTL